MDTLKKRIKSLPLIAVDINFPEEGEYIEEIVGDCEVRFTHEFWPHHGADFVATIRGTESGFRESLNLISELIGGCPCLLFNRSPKKVFWKSPSKEIPEGRIVKLLGKDKIQEICDSVSLPIEFKWIVDRAIALTGWFMVYSNHESEKKHLEQLIKELHLADQNKIIAVLHFVNMEYTDRIKKLVSRPG